MKTVQPNTKIDTEAIQKTLANVAASFTKLMQVTVAALRPIIDSVYSSFHDAYVRAGAPHGDTKEGLLRWYQEGLAHAAEQQQRQTAAGGNAQAKDSAGEDASLGLPIPDTAGEL